MCVHGTGSFVDLIIGPEPPVNSGLSEGSLPMPARRQDGGSHFAVETYVATTGSALNWCAGGDGGRIAGGDVRACPAGLACAPDGSGRARLVDRRIDGDDTGRSRLRPSGRHRAFGDQLHRGG
ncbi:hypothetical protein G6F32_016297 [Rhizopus arrhizus]|nr:hypothetical protein G6F32_016297 [Rhizopus arrhizus]